MKSHLLHTVWCNISGKAAVEIWHGHSWRSETVKASKTGMQVAQRFLSSHAMGNPCFPMMTVFCLWGIHHSGTLQLAVQTPLSAYGTWMSLFVSEHSPDSSELTVQWIAVLPLSRLYIHLLYNAYIHLLYNAYIHLLYNAYIHLLYNAYIHLLYNAYIHCLVPITTVCVWTSMIGEIEGLRGREHG